MHNKTCQRLKNSITDGCEIIVIEKNGKWRYPDKEKVIRTSLWLSRNGKGVRTVRLIDFNKNCWKTIKKNCKNMETMVVDVNLPTFNLARIPKLKALELCGDRLHVGKWLDRIKDLSTLKSLRLPYHKNLMKFLPKLPNLKWLSLDKVPGNHHHMELFYLQNLKSLTHLTVTCTDEHFNKIVKRLVAAFGGNRKAPQLTLKMPYDAETFKHIAEFTNLEFLTMVHTCPTNAPELPKSVFENLSSNLKLKRIDLEDLTISSTNFSSMVHNLEYLKELVVRNITCIHDKAKRLNDSKFVDAADRLQLDNRSLKVIYSRPCQEMELHECNFNSGHLKIIHRYFEPIRSESQFIYTI